MDRLRNISLRDRGIRIAGSFIVASCLIGVGAQTEGKAPYVYEPLTKDDTHTLVLNEAQTSDLRINIQSPPLEPKLSSEKQKIQNTQDQADHILQLAKDSGEFKPDLLDDLQDNLPFYLAAGKKYNIDWVVLWVIHERESGASDPDSMAFDPSKANSRVQGSWQIDISWDEDFAKESYKGLEYTKAFPQRHEGDRIGAAEAAHMLRRNLDKYEDQGYETALLKAMSIYCGQEPPEREVDGSDEVNNRLDKIQKFNEIFSDQIASDVRNRMQVSRFRSRS